MAHEINFLLMYTGVRPDMKSQFGLGLSENALTQCSASSPFYRTTNAVILCSWFLLLWRSVQQWRTVYRGTAGYILPIFSLMWDTFEIKV